MLDVTKNGDESAGHKVSWDWTVNVPTLITLTVLLISVIAWGIDTYSGMDKRVSSRENVDDVLRRDVDRLDNETKALRAEQASKIDALRGEMRGELRDVNGKLDQLLLRRGN